MAVQALAVLTESSSTWRPNEVLRELARAVPTTVHESPDHLVSSLERLTERLLEDSCVDLTPARLGPIRQSDGRPTSESVLDRRYTTEAILDEERAIAEWADDRFSSPGAPAHLVQVERLDPVQAHAAALVAGTHPLVVIVGARRHRQDDHAPRCRRQPCR